MDQAAACWRDANHGMPMRDSLSDNECYCYVVGHLVQEFSSFGTSSGTEGLSPAKYSSKGHLFSACA